MTDEILSQKIRFAKQAPPGYYKSAAERARLEREVIKTCSAYCQSVLDIEDNGWPKGMTINEAHVQHAEKQTAMIDAYKALLEFESKQK